MTTARAIAAAVRGGADPGAWAHAALALALADSHHAFLHVDAAAVDAQLAHVDRAGPLAGVPVALKDNLADAGQPCGCASRALQGHRAVYSATVVERLRRAGAVVVGRTNMDEFAMGSSTEHSAYGPTRNPRDPSRAPGGSSGGSAAAVAAGIVPLALGSDTGGSVRQPAAFCGVVGVKPTWGRVSRRGLVAFARSLDVVAPFAADVRDAALVTGVIAGPDDGDATSADRPVGDYVAACERGVAGLRVGVPGEADGVEPGVAEAVARAADALREAGATIVPVSLPSWRPALAAYAVLAPAEAASNLARYDGVRFGPREPGGVTEARAAGLGPEVTRRVLLGTWALSARGAGVHARAVATRARFTAELTEALRHVDVLLSPTSPTVAFPLGARVEDPVAMYLADAFTVPASLAGLPAISVPCGHSGGLPVGAQLVGRAFDEATLFAAAAVIEAASGAASGAAS